MQRWFSLRYFPNCPTKASLGEAETYIAPANSYYFIPPNVLYKVVGQDGNHHPEYYDIIFHFDEPDEPSEKNQYQQLHPPRYADLTAKTMLNYVIENWYRQDAESESICNSFLTSLVALLFAEETKSESMGSQFILTDDYSKSTLCALGYIERQYLTRFTLDELANATGYNKTYLCANFSKNTGISIVTYTNFLRIRKAIGTILFYPNPINYISQSLAFDNPNYFGRIFKSFTGLSPQAFNRIARKMTAEEKAALRFSEPLLNYQLYPISVALQSMRHIGTALKSFSDT